MRWETGRRQIAVLMELEVGLDSPVRVVEAILDQ